MSQFDRFQSLVKPIYSLGHKTILVCMFRSYLHDNTEGGEFFWPTLVFILLEVKMYWHDLLSDSAPPVVPHFASKVYVSYLPPPDVTSIPLFVKRSEAE